MELFHWLVSSGIFCMLLKCNTAGRFRCPQDLSNMTGFHLTRGVPSPSVYSCLGQYKKISCCAVGYNSIWWYQSTEKAGVSSYTAVQMRHDVYTEERNQSLVIQATSRNLSLRCDIVDTVGHKYQYETSLVVFDCGHHSGPPEWIDPKKTLYRAFQHDNVSLTCAGYYGSSGDLGENRNQVIWEKQPPGGSAQLILQKNASSPYVFYDPRVTINTKTELNGNILISVVSISDVQEDDFAGYVCKMANGIIGGPTIVNFTLEELISQKVITKKAELPVSVAVGVVLAVIILVVCVSLYCRLEIKLCYIFLKDRLGLVKDKGDKDYDVFVLYNEDSDDDYQFTCDGLKNQLEKQYNYHVCLSHRDFEPGDVKVNNYLNTLKRSRCMILVISPEFICDDWCVYTALQALSMTEHPSFIFVNFKTISSNDWSENQAGGQLYSDHKKLKSAMKLGYSIKWPGSDTARSSVSQRKMKRFWKQVRVHMPAIPRATDVEKRNRIGGDVAESHSDRRKNRYNSDTTHPLLESDEKLHVKYGEASANNHSKDNKSEDQPSSKRDATCEGPSHSLMSPVGADSAVALLSSPESNPHLNPLTVELKNQNGKGHVVDLVPKYVRQPSTDSGLGNTVEVNASINAGQC